MHIQLKPLQQNEKETFIRNIQIAFKKAVVEQFGPFDEEVIPRDHVIRSFEAEGAESSNILLDGEVVGGTVLAIHPDTKRKRAQYFIFQANRRARGAPALQYRWPLRGKCHVLHPGCPRAPHF